MIKSRRMSWAEYVELMGESRGVIKVMGGILRDKDNLEDPDIDGDNIKMDIYEGRCGRMDWINLAHNSDRWRALVDAVINI
jgi:hypothetical protein